MTCAKRYVSKGIADATPLFLQNIIWYAIDTMTELQKDKVQIFELSTINSNNTFKQKITNSQSKPLYNKEFILSSSKLITNKVLVVKNNLSLVVLLSREF